jgi:gliding motility-associated-like protein
MIKLLLRKSSFSYYTNGLFALLLITFLLSFNSKAQVVASFSATPVKGCSPLVVSFTDHSTGGATSWSWNFGDGQTSVLQNPGAIYTNSGVYTVTLTVSNGSSSNTIIQTNYITVYANPTAGFTLSTDTACVGQMVKFTNATVIGSGGAAISSWAWDFGDGHAQTVTTTTVSHSYTTPGSYPISLIVTDMNGCTSSITETVVVVSPPTPAFIANPVSGCSAPLSVTFTNNSTSSGVCTYIWHFGDGGTSNQMNPTHTYTANGSYNVTLIVNQHGCIDSTVMPDFINIQNMNAGFTATPSVVCTGQSISFTNTSIPAAVSANWVFGDGGTSTTINPIYTYTAAGTYTVTLAATGAGGCSGNATKIVTVNQTPVAAFLADTMVACSVPFVVTFTNNSTGASTYHWNFGDGNTSASINPVNTYTAPGTYTVTLIATNSTGVCSDSIVKNSFIVISPPVAGFTSIPDSGCVPLVVNLTSNSTSALFPITSYTWSYGDGNSGTSAAPNATNTYTVSGIFSPTLTVQTGSGCTNTFVCTNCIKTGTAPVASFTISPDSVCYGSPIMPINTSTGATGWNWLFGDAGMSNIQNPMHIYADTGKYQIKLVAYNNGCTDTSLITPVVVLAPKAQFTYTLSCSTYFTVHFTSTSEGADSLVWKFGDGTQDTANDTNTVHTYLATGAVTCTLIAYNYKSHCVDSTMSSFTIAKPIANFTESDSIGCYPFTPVFTSTSQDANTYFWNFGVVASTSDTANVANPSYTYNTPGKNFVKLVITDVNGCKDSITKKLVTMGSLPYFHASPLKGCTPLIVNFIDSTISDSGIVQWSWNFGDGNSLSYTVAPHFPPINNYTVSGSYNVTLVVTDKDGCKDSLVKVGYINSTFPVPNYSVLPIPFSCKGNIVTFNASTTNAVGPQYSWNFGDGTTSPASYNPVTTHSYSTDGLYHVMLTVTDTNGCTSSYTDTMLILKPKANFSYNIVSTGCGNMQVSFSDSSSGYPNSWQWNFGNGANSILSNPTYDYTQPGYYNVTLIVTNPGGCTDTITKDSLFVVPGPTGSFSYAPVSGCSPLTVTFVGHSTNSQSYTWAFGDGTVITGTDSVTHTFTQAGVFNPILVLTGTTTIGTCPNNATDLSAPIAIINSVNVSITPNTVTLGEDSTTTVVGTASGVNPTYSWTPSTTNISCFTCSTINVTGTGDTLVYTLTATDLNGCQGTATLLVLSTPCIDKKRIPNIFTPNGDNRNDGFYIPGLCPEENYSLQVYDRWGSLQFTATERNHAWDGKTTKGNDAPDGTYFFIVKVNGNTYKGFVQLIR